MIRGITTRKKRKEIKLCKKYEKLKDEKKQKHNVNVINERIEDAKKEIGKKKPRDV